jgi:hypothetical protein
MLEAHQVNFQAAQKKYSGDFVAFVGKYVHDFLALFIVDTLANIYTVSLRTTPTMNSLCCCSTSFERLILAPRSLSAESIPAHASSLMPSCK